MLQIIGGPAVASQNYYITRKENGIDELTFEVSRSDPAYKAISEQTRILETTEQQYYCVKKIAAAGSSATITCKLDLEDWQRYLFVRLERLDMSGFNHEFREDAMLTFLLDDQNYPNDPGQCPAAAGWTASAEITSHKRREIDMQAPTPLDVIEQMQRTFGCAFRFNTAQKRVTIYYPNEKPVTNAYAVESVNLLEAPTYKGSSGELFTRLYPIGKANGQSAIGIAEALVDGIPYGLPYVENTTYTGGAVISRVWKDDRYIDAEALLADALEKLREGCVPVRSWQLNIADLHAISPGKYPDMALEIHRKLRLIDEVRGLNVLVQIREMKKYPYFPEKTVLTVSTAAQSVQKTVNEIKTALTNPNSEFWQQMKARG